MSTELESSKPDWADAPEWAQWLAIVDWDCEYRGQWTWFRDLSSTSPYSKVVLCAEQRPNRTEGTTHMSTEPAPLRNIAHRKPHLRAVCRALDPFGGLMPKPEWQCTGQWACGYGTTCREAYDNWREMRAWVTRVEAAILPPAARPFAPRLPL